MVALARHVGCLPSELRHQLGLASPWSPQQQDWLEGTLPMVLRAWRSSEGMSQRAAARYLGVSPGALEQWERGVVPGPRHVDVLAAVWGVGPEAVRASAGPDRVRRPETAGGPRTTALARARQSAGLTQRELSSLLCVSGATLSRWECALRRPHTDDVRRISAVLRRPVSEVEAMFDGYPPAARDVVGRLPGLRALVASHGFDAAAVAHRLDLPSDDVVAWLAGRRSAPRVFVRSLGELLDVDLGTDLTVVRRAGTPGSSTRHQLAVRRAHLGVSQQQLADRLGVARASVANWESGRAPVPVIHLRRVARALGWDEVTASELLQIPLPPAPDLASARPGELGEVVAMLRRRTGLTAVQLGRAVGVAGGTVRRWERGASRPSRLAIGRLSLAFGVPERDLVRLTQPRRPGAASPGALAG